MGISYRQRDENHLNSNLQDDRRQVVLDYFRLIKEKDMPGLLNIFTDDCIIYEPFSRGSIFHNSDGAKKSYLKGSSEIESFLKIVMMASDGLQYEIKFIDEPMNIKYEQSNDDFDATPSSSSIISALATFYGNEGADELKGWLTFHVLPEKNNDSAIKTDNDYNNISNKKKIKTLLIQFCSPAQ
jgi:hypothetical protein